MSILECMSAANSSECSYWIGSKTKPNRSTAVKILKNQGRIVMVQGVRRLPSKSKISTYMNTEGDAIRSAHQALKVALFLVKS